MLRSLRYVGVRVSLRGGGPNPINSANVAGAASRFLAAQGCVAKSAAHAVPLVLESGGNGRMGGISEMFGSCFRCGCDDPFTHDDNGDGKFLIADAAWVRLKVWRDKGREGKSKMGMLRAGNGNWCAQDAREAA